jgi:PAS domain S-box-containing protein
LLRDALETAPHAILVAEEDGTILFVNELAEALFAYSPGELVGQPLSRLPLELPGHEDWWAELWRGTPELWRGTPKVTPVTGLSMTGRRRDGVVLPIGKDGARVLAIYTPPEKRGRGYAQAMTAALTQRAFDEGRWCTLFTDADNPITNKIYPRVGYRYLSSYTSFRFVPA